MRWWIVVALVGCGSQSAPPPAAPAPTPTLASTPAPVATEPAEPAVAGADEPPPTSEDSAVSPDASSAQMVPPSVLETRRVKGSISIQPDDTDKVEMVKRGFARVIHSSKLCIAIDGHISSVTTLRSSGLPGYDEKIRKQISGWQYTPFQINGKPAPVCTAVTIIYNQSPPRRR